ncbi:MULTISPECIES: class I SAM-dependent methyltransferase [Micromonospora]|uniref:Methyltransferase domain-containing protein n=1 Tax=Micromonospora yangpuensis TaxID=683228 RepID=A0A1C6UL39_9ACTN|nr:class I SAM-dependent methyltransferase [Micromonospora yangpuensis]SCL54569.1 Methyltransferase domain-containing protein [Micromonospora yangpuensis]
MNWYEDDELWSGFAEVLFTPERAARAAEAVATSPLLRFAPGTHVLDQCCGTGTFTVPIARQGHHVTGVDLSPAMLARARRACDDAGVEAELVRADMRDYVRPARFDVVLNLYTSFGYFDTDEQNLRVLRNAHDSLRPGGVLVVDLLGKECYARWAGQPKVVDVEDGRVFMHDTVLDGWTRYRTEWTLVRAGVVRQVSLTQCLYSGAELRRLVEAAGFVDVRCFGGFAGQPYDCHATRLVVRGTRAG